MSGAAGEEAGGSEIMELVRWQVALGPRFPGSEAHRLLRSELGARLERYARGVVRQEFSVDLPGGRTACANLIGWFPGSRGSRSLGNSLLLGSHFDTRLQADREADPGRRRRPIPGANDGGSGTAVLLHLLPFLAEGRHERDVTVVFFDAEDVGDIAGNPFALGARRFVEEAPVGLPREAIVLDMVGGRGLRLDVDAHVLHHPPSLALTRRLFRLGQDMGAGAFAASEKLRYIISDQYPLMAAGVAACLLIDLDYPQWHTQEDLPEAMAAQSLATVAGVLRRFLLLPAR